MSNILLRPVRRHFTPERWRASWRALDTPKGFGTGMAPRFIKIRTSDGFTFVVPREAALVSGTWQRTLSSENYIESQTGELTIDEPAEIVATIVDYLFYHLKYRGTDGQPGSEFYVPPELALQVLVAADYLNV